MPGLAGKEPACPPASRATSDTIYIDVKPAGRPRSSQKPRSPIPRTSSAIRRSFRIFWIEQELRWADRPSPRFRGAGLIRNVPFCVPSIIEQKDKTSNSRLKRTPLMMTARPAQTQQMLLQMKRQSPRCAGRNPPLSKLTLDVDRDS
jgi:hypothetical protein